MKRLLLIFVVFFGLFGGSASAEETWESDVWRAYTIVVETQHYDPATGSFNDYAQASVNYPYWNAAYPYDRFKWNGETPEDSELYQDLTIFYVVLPNTNEQPTEIQSATFDFYAAKQGTLDKLNHLQDFYYDGHWIRPFYTLTPFDGLETYEVVTEVKFNGVTYDFIHNLKIQGTINNKNVIFLI